MLLFITSTENMNQACTTELLQDELILRIARGEQSAMEQLYRLTDKAVYGFILSILKNRHDAQDVMQETFLRIRLAAATYHAQGKPMAWVLTIARNQALMHLRKAKSQPLEEQMETSGENLQSEVEENLIVRQTLNQLQEKERQIIMLHAVAGLKHREIAQLLSLSLPAVLSGYSRGVKKLKKILEKEEHSQ